MLGIRETAAAAALALALAACAGPYQQGERLYSQGDIAGAIDVWRDIPPENSDYEKAHTRLDALEGELASSLVRYEKRAQFFEDEGRLAEAVLYYRLALRLDPDRPQTLAKAQQLYRELQAKTAAERAKLAGALAEGDLRAANDSAERLQTLDPFDPAIQIELRQVNAETGAQVLRWLEDGKRAYSVGDRMGARTAFERVTALDPENEPALGYLSYLRRYDQDGESARATTPEPRPTETGRIAALPPPPILSPQDVLAEGRFRSGRKAEEAGDPYRAIREYQAALRADERHVLARQRLVALRQELAPRVPALYEQGKRYFQDEDLEKALQVWRNALLIDPGDQRTRENVDRAERILSRLEEIQTRGP